MKVPNMMRFCAAALMLASVAPSINAQSSVAANGNKLTMNQWVHLNSDGNLHGRIVLTTEKGLATALGAVHVAIRDRDGQTTQFQTGTDGKFKFDSLKPGVYSLVAQSPNAFAVVALHVLAADKGYGYGFPDFAEISMAKLATSTAQMAIARYMPPNLPKDEASIAGADFDKLAPIVYGTELSQIVQHGQGLKGKILCAGAEGTEIRAANRANVFLFQDGVEVVRTVTDKNGHFQLESLATGFYSLLAIGRDGIGSMGFVLVNEEQAKETVKRIENASSTETLVMQYGCCGVQDEFVMQLAPVPDAIEMVQAPLLDGCSVDTCGVPIPACGCAEVVETSAPATPASGGYTRSGVGGGGGGGGGGGFGGFGLGGLGALGGVLAALANNGGGGGISVVIPSPSVPGG
jgi:hypothetical protein